MFETSNKNCLPGYTGHIPGKIEEDYVPPKTEARKHIPGTYILYLTKIFAGYGGYVPGVKSENVFGQTYGKTSYASSAGTFHRGIDEPSNIKYQSMFKAEFIEHSKK
jgi:hypothetical protein